MERGDCNGLPGEATNHFVAGEVVDLWERVFLDESTKDVQIVAKGGERLRAHSVVLANVSDVFKAMFSHNMKENVSHEIELHTYTKAQLQFFLRLAYTGQVDPNDWGELLDGDAESSIRSGIPLGRRSAPCNPGQSLLLSDSSESSSSLSSSEEKSGVHLVRPVKGKGKTKGKTSNMLLMMQYRQHKGLGKGKGAEFTTGPPLELLLAGAELSKKYEVRGFLQKFIEKIKKRLTVGNFNEIATFAISNDIGPLRFFCMRFAETDVSREIHRLYKAGKLNHLVLFELQALWPPLPPESNSRKRKDFF